MATIQSETELLKTETTATNVLYILLSKYLRIKTPYKYGQPVSVITLISATFGTH